MQDAFEKIIAQNRDVFDTQLPPADMWDRIAGDVPELRVKAGIRLTTWMKAVAAVMVVVLTTSIGWQLMKHENQTVASPLSEVETQIQEAAYFYESQISEKQQAVIKLTAHQPVVRQEMTMDMAELDSALAEIKEDLKDNVSNKEVLEAMIQTYRMKLDILEQILSYVDKDKSSVEEEKNINHEL